MAFEDNVFINCPFDEDYYQLLRPLLFTVLYLGFQPRISSERNDSGEARFEKICELVGASKYAIHDLSRIEATKRGELFRLNMPFELGLDVGCRRFGQGAHAQKQCLILETKRYRYQAAISDLSNSDIAAHNDDPHEVVVQVRNWLAQRMPVAPADGASRIFGSFIEFMAANDEDLQATGHSKAEIANLPVSELMDRMQVWVLATK